MSQIILKNERLILREFKISDARDLSKLGNDEEISFYTWYIKYPFPVGEARKLIKTRIDDAKLKERSMYEFAVILEDTGEIIGQANIHNINHKNRNAEIGYWLGKNYRGKGYAQEAALLVINFSFKRLKLNKLSAEALTCNKPSNKLLKKLGFRKVGTRREQKFLRNKFWDTNEWELLNKE